MNGEIANVDIDIIRINTAVSDLHDELRQLQDQYNSAQSNRKGNITRQINAWHRDHAARLQKLEEERKTQFSRRDDLHNQADRIAEKVATVATQIDIFASGAGGALNNNLGFRDFVRPTHMSDYNYTFEFSHSSPPPSPSATLRWDIEQHRGDSFTSREQIDVVASEPDGTVVDTADLSVGNQPTHAGRDEQLVIHQPNSNRVRITLPWHHARVSDNAVYARTIYLYWDQGTLAHADVRIFRVTIEKVRILDSRDVGDGEYRIFVEVGGYWLFVNEFVSDDNILEDGLGDTGGGDDSDYDWQINQSIAVVLRPGDTFRVHADGWEADGFSDKFGFLMDPNSSASEALEWIYRNAGDMIANGFTDDNIGEINQFHDAEIGSTSCDSSNGSFRLYYRIEEVSSDLRRGRGRDM